MLNAVGITWKVINSSQDAISSIVQGAIPKTKENNVVNFMIKLQTHI